MHGRSEGEGWDEGVHETTDSLILSREDINECLRLLLEDGEGFFHDLEWLVHAHALYGDYEERFVIRRYLHVCLQMKCSFSLPSSMLSAVFPSSLTHSLHIVQLRGLETTALLSIL